MLGTRIRENVEKKATSKEYKLLFDLTINKYLNGEYPTTEEVLKEMIDKDIDMDTFNAFVMKECLYCIPTKELIDILNEETEGFSKVIEIGSGNGYLSKCLGIQGTDSKVQQKESIKRYIESLGQYAMEYKDKEVRKLDDIDAIRVLNPDCVIASWTTDKLMKDGRYGKQPFSFEYGVRDWEYVFTKNVKKYIFIGNDLVHSEKLLFRKDLLIENCIKNKIGVRVRLIYNETLSRKIEGNNIIVVVERTDNPNLLILNEMEIPLYE